MNPILLSFLCGAAFIGGAAATTILVVLAVTLRNSKGQKELLEYWRSSIEKHGMQIARLERIAVAVEELAAEGKPIRRVESKTPHTEDV